MSAELLNLWLTKAEQDYRVARRELRTRGLPSYDAVCFHAQQCAEKYFKAFLTSSDIKFSKMHDLRELCRLCATVDSSFDSLAETARRLNPFAVDVRYPGLIATKEDARAAFAAMDQVRQFVRSRLGLK